MENDETRDRRHTFAEALKEYRDRVNADPDDEKAAAQEVAEKHGVTQKDLREQALAGV